MNKIVSLALTMLILLAGLALLVWFGYNLLYNDILPNSNYNLLFECLVMGGFGGIIYCLRGVYLNFCVKKSWDNDWMVWYIVRPIVSFLCGGVGYLILKAGLLVLEAKKETDASNFGFLAFSFIAGLNVDKFISKIEDLAKATWGIEKSRTSGGENK